MFDDCIKAKTLVAEIQCHVLCALEFIFIKKGI